MQNLNDLAEKLNKENSCFPYFKCSFDSNLCDSVTIHASKQTREEFVNGIFHNSPYVIISIMPKTHDGEEKPNCKYEAELLSWGFSRDVRTPMRKKSGDLDKIYIHLQKFFESL
jgi:hypothetical protein